MGGPCQVDGKTIGTGSATDNFATLPQGFPLSTECLAACFPDEEGFLAASEEVFYSSEHAYQWLKVKNLADRKKIAALAPKDNESDWDFGMRCWNAGQRAEQSGQVRKHWHSKKVFKE